MRLLEVWFALSGGPSLLPLECAWSQALARLPGTRIPAPGFGSSDCRCACPAHLVAFPDGLPDEAGMDCILFSAPPD
jgi:hypothetical protein